MTDLRETVPAAPPHFQGRLLYGTMAEDANSVSQRVTVILPEFDETRSWGPCRWQSRDAVSLPARGDECLVAFDNHNQPWIVAWWPYA